MKKKEIIFWAVLIGVCIIFASVVIFYKPITAPSKYESLSVHAGDKSYSVKPDDAPYKELKKAVNRAVNSSQYNLLNPSTPENIVCSENTVWRYKLSRHYWVECFPSYGKYEKLFFWVDEDAAGRQTMVVFASENKESYDGGKLILLYSVDTPALLQALKSLA